MLDDTESLLLAGNPNAAKRKLEDLRGRVDGCGGTPDANDWILDCQQQTTVRSLVDLLMTNLEL